MLFHAEGIENRAVWNAMKLHAELILRAGEDIVFVVHKNNRELIDASFVDAQIMVYENQLELMKKIYTHQDNKIFSPTMFSVLSMSLGVLLKKKKVYYWIQGAVPEESYMRHQSGLRKFLLLSIEYLAVRLSSYQVLVSSYMKTFFEKKYSFGLHSIVVPCTSSLSFTDDKKEKNSFVYVGGLSAWQKLDQILLMFNKIIEHNKDAKFYIATGDVEKAKELCSKFLTEEAAKHINIQNIATREEMTSFLNTKEYGFLIREDDTVNNVASPIKLAEYLSTGTNVIISSGLTSYAKDVESHNAGIVVQDVEDVEKLNHVSSDAEKALIYYEKTFSEVLFIKEYQSILS